MATIKPIEGRSVHQIQSGQVIVDLCSVVKELVENSLDAGATAIDVRFRNQGLEAIEVQDNGVGMSVENYDSIALKHYTSKLSSYDDLSSLNTFGFRGEALSSLCALSKFHLVTAKDGEAPKGSRLDFEQSGALKSVSVCASQRGTVVSVEDLFYNLPVRRRELEKNIKREYGKLLNVLHAYACISTNVRFTVSNQATKGKKTVMFSTKPNRTTRENIANVYGMKTVSALVPLDLVLEIQSTDSSQVLAHVHEIPGHSLDSRIHVLGHVSKPVSGEGRQTPDRQMFFVNSRPCGLPQISKAFNDVYRSYNITQSPFVFANFEMNTAAYDVNVSPDKRSIMLHDQAALLEKLKHSLVSLFESQNQTVPLSQFPAPKLPAFKPLIVTKDVSSGPAENDGDVQRDVAQADLQATGVANLSASSAQSSDVECTDLIGKFASRDAMLRKEATGQSHALNEPSKEKQKLAKAFAVDLKNFVRDTNGGSSRTDKMDSEGHIPNREAAPRVVRDFNDRLAGLQVPHEQHADNAENDSEELGFFLKPAPTDKTLRTGQNNSNAEIGSARPERILNNSIYSVAAQDAKPIAKRRRIEGQFADDIGSSTAQNSQFAARLRAFGAPGTQLEELKTSTVSSKDINALQGSSEYASEEESVDAIGNYEDEHTLDASELKRVDDHGNNNDEDPVDESEERRKVHLRVQRLVEEAEEAAVPPSQGNKRRAARLLKSNSFKDSTVGTITTLCTNIDNIQRRLLQLNECMRTYLDDQQKPPETSVENEHKSKMSAEDRLSLTITKSDFSKMRIVGQFNLGFVLAVRPTSLRGPSDPRSSDLSDDLFIIDQHASDEIYNFHRLTASTTLTPQPLVRPHVLALTAIEEETAIAHAHASLAKNGFKIEIDTSGDVPVGSRVKLLTLPTSRDTVFDTRDMEELLSLLVDAPEPPPPLDEDEVDDNGGWNASTVTVVPSYSIVRPSKVRKMLAMRACRSSIMVGKTLSHNGMERIVKHMGEIDRPWNCPHGRPTMRHLAGLGNWESWSEGDFVGDEEHSAWQLTDGRGTDWHGWLGRRRQQRASSEDRELDAPKSDEAVYDEYADEGGEGVEGDAGDNGRHYHGAA
ncbi:MAG: hypothetical protein M1828_002538 [Chrysothrix sp. TS-e1954]|nr:MAG: hypothetical protein M1828_002538 [Chrysothrix sp. TS-e1954]